MSPTGRAATLTLLGAGLVLLPSTAHANRFPSVAEVGLILLGAGLVIGLVTGLLAASAIYLYARDRQRALRAGVRVGIGVSLVLGVALALILLLIIS